MKSRILAACLAVAAGSLASPSWAQFSTGGGSPPEQAIGAVVEPSARSIAMTSGASVVFSATVTDPGGGGAALGCTVELPGQSGSFSYRTTDANGNPTGMRNAPFSIPAGGEQHLELTYYPVSAALSGEVLSFRFDCGNRHPALAVHGVNLGYLTTSPATSPTPDLVASLNPATVSASGDLAISGQTGEGYLSAAAVNLGAQGLVRVQAMSPEDFLAYTTATQDEVDAASDLDGASFTLCRAFYGNCVHSPYVVADTATFSGNSAVFDIRVFGANAPIVFAPHYNRVFLVFTEESTGRLIGASSIAVCSDSLPRC